MIDVVVATANWHKFHELTRLLAMPGIRWHSLKEFPHVSPAKEDQKTFDANAIKKARAVARATGFTALADDSGIEVGALKGAPGIYSARFAGRHGDDLANNNKLLRLMKGVPASKRGARYFCSLALVAPQRVLAVSRGIWHGKINCHPKGAGGFGYDPVVFIPRLGKTVAQLPKYLKRKYSHRSIAAKRMLPHLRRLARVR